MNKLSRQPKRHRSDELWSLRTQLAAVHEKLAQERKRHHEEGLGCVMEELDYGVQVYGLGIYLVWYFCTSGSSW